MTKHVRPREDRVLLVRFLWAHPFEYKMLKKLFHTSLYDYKRSVYSIIWQSKRCPGEFPTSYVLHRNGHAKIYEIEDVERKKTAPVGAMNESDLFFA